MINNIIQEQLIKNNINYNANKLDVIVLNRFDGSKNLFLQVSSVCYGFVYLNIIGVSGILEIKYNGIVLHSCSDDGFYIIPVKFSKNSHLNIVGVCESLVVGVVGAGLENNMCFENFLPNNNIVVNRSGNGKLLSYSDVSGFILNQITVNQNINDYENYQTFLKDGLFYVGKVGFDSDVYFCTSVDNYTNKILIENDVDSAIFLQDSENSFLGFVYLKDNKLYGKILQNNDLNGSNVLFKNFKYKPIRLVSSITNKFSSKLFAVQCIGGNYLIFLMKSNKTFEKIYEVKAKSIRIIENSDCSKLVLCDDYSVDVFELDVDETMVSSDVLNVKSVIRYNNAIDYVELGEDKILTSISGIKSVINDD